VNSEREEKGKAEETFDSRWSTPTPSDITSPSAFAGDGNQVEVSPLALPVNEQVQPCHFPPAISHNFTSIAGKNLRSEQTCIDPDESQHLSKTIFSPVSNSFPSAPFATPEGSFVDIRDKVGTNIQKAVYIISSSAQREKCHDANISSPLHKV